jgi:protein SDA1
MIVELVSRLVGVHQLLLLNLYPLLQRFLQPHQREVTQILRCAAQAAHENVPPEELEPVLRAIVDNFVTERNSGDVMAVGLNTVREMCARCPLVMTQELLADLSQYRTHKDKGVNTAARSLITLYRELNPELLVKKYRGRPNQGRDELSVKQFGEVGAKDYIPGAEVLALEGGDEGGEEDEEGKDWETDSEEEEDDGEEWEQMSEGEEKEENVTKEEEEIKDETKLEDEKESVETGLNCKVNEETDPNKGNEKQSENTEGSNAESKKDRKSKIKKEEEEKKHAAVEERVSKAREISLNRILTQEEVDRIRLAQLKKQVTKADAKGGKRKIEEPEEQEVRSEVVPISAIERVQKKSRGDKETRLASVLSARENKNKWKREQHKSPHASSSNREKLKHKTFTMVKHKVKGKQKRSFRDKQVALRDALIKQRRLLLVK